MLRNMYKSALICHKHSTRHCTKKMDYNIAKNGLKLESHVILSQNLVQDLLLKDNFFKLAEVIRDRFKVILTPSVNQAGRASLCPMTRFPLCEETISQLLHILKLYLENDKKYTSDHFKKLFIETAKALRTYAVTEDTRKYLNTIIFFETLKKIIEKFSTEEQPQLYHKFTFQLLLNILTLDDAQSSMHDTLFDDICHYFLKFTDESFECYEASALLWNLTRSVGM